MQYFTFSSNVDFVTKTTTGESVHRPQHTRHPPPPDLLSSQVQLAATSAAGTQVPRRGPQRVRLPERAWQDSSGPGGQLLCARPLLPVCPTTPTTTLHTWSFDL